MVGLCLCEFGLIDIISISFRIRMIEKGLLLLTRERRERKKALFGWSSLVTLSRPFSLLQRTLETKNTPKTLLKTIQSHFILPV